MAIKVATSSTWLTFSHISTPNRWGAPLSTFFQQKPTGDSHWLRLGHTLISEPITETKGMESSDWIVPDSMSTDESGLWDSDGEGVTRPPGPPRGWELQEGPEGSNLGFAAHWEADLGQVL